jgi:hypothetical protein
MSMSGPSYRSRPPESILWSFALTVDLVFPGEKPHEIVGGSEYGSEFGDQGGLMRGVPSTGRPCTARGIAGIGRLADFSLGSEMLLPLLLDARTDAGEVPGDGVPEGDVAEK